MIPTEQTAYKFFFKPHRLEKVTVPVPQPNPEEVLIKIEAAGACHSDLHIISGRSKMPVENYVMGHEIAGVIVAHGSAVDQTVHPLNSRVALFPGNSCGDCAPCRSGADHGCCPGEYRWFGLGTDGGYQRYVAARARSAIPVPDGLSPEVAAVATDAVLTPYHAIKRAGINAQSRVLIIGCGGLGLNAVQICKHLGAIVTVTDIRQSAMDNAKKYGADETVAELGVDYTQSRNFDVVLDIVGMAETFATAQIHVKPRGIIVPMGLAEELLTLVAPLTSVREIKIQGTFSGSSSEMVECLDLCARGLVTPKFETHRLDDIHQQLERLDNGQVESRLVFHP